MYSDVISRLLSEKGISVGDRISFEYKGLKISGELMPKTEIGNPDVLVIKLENGYNIGMMYYKSANIVLIEKGKGSPKFPTLQIRKSAELDNICLIYTGGTIGSKIDYKTGGVYMLTEPGELLYEVPELSKMANIEIRHLFSIASEDISYIEWQQIASEVASALADGAKGVVITMGTDAMHYTSAALSFMLKNLNAPVIITGAQRSSDRGSSDAFFNLQCAVKLAASSDIAELGICMHATSSDDKCMLIRGTRARKMHTSRRDAFRPINSAPIAYVNRDMSIEYVGEYKKVEPIKKQIELKIKYEPKVALIKSHPNSDPSIIDFYVKKGYRGIVIEGTGLGHVPASTKHKSMLWLDNIKHAIDQNVVVCMVSQCVYGRVNSNVYRNLRLVSNLGVVYCEDMTAESALAKLSWLLGNYKEKEAATKMLEDISGEIGNRLELEEFLN